MIRNIFASAEKSAIARAVLSDLPDWFGLPEAKENYIAMSRELPFWAAYTEGMSVGFIVLKETSCATAEIFVMGVLKSCHRRGIGRALFQCFEAYAREAGYSFLQVKTVKMGRYPEYDATNRFYLSMGFQEFECFPDLWDASNPCQIYVKYIG